MAQLSKKFDGADRATTERLELEERGVPLARLGEPEEIAAAVYLAQASFVTGQIHVIDGGNVRAL
jgi:NAD(P)-dependent dehydrogenase (short-subunit alcohol dehydrogenase family)